MHSIGSALAVATLLLGAPPEVAAPVPPLGVARPQQSDPELRAARREVLRGSVEEALTLLNDLAIARPESSEVALWYGHALKRSGDSSGAAHQYLRALRLDPDSAGALIALGDLQSAAGDLRRGLAYYQRAIGAAPEFPLGYRKAAGIEVQLILHADAIGHLRRYLELRPGDAVAMRVMGLEQYLDEDVDGAVATLEQALALDPDNAQGHFGLGMALADRAGDYERALRHLREAVAGEPGNAMALYLIGKIHALRSELEEARDALEASLARDPAQPDAHYRIALVYARLGDRESATRHQQSFLKLSNARDESEEVARRIELLKEAAAIAMAAVDLEQVRAAADRLATLAPNNADVLMVRARMALASGDSDEALTITDRILALYPDHWEAAYLRGVLLHKSARPEEARELLERSIAGNPLYAPAYAALGNSWVQLGEHGHARSAYESAVRLDPRSAAHYLNLAVVYAALGESELEARALATHRRLLREQ